MKYNFTPVILKVVKILEKEGLKVQRMRGDHIIINREPSLRRPIVLVNVKRLSNAVRQNLMAGCREAGIKEEIIKELDEMLRD
jgi:predicted RNA binding protein YcfA (HicA-like mRNA interferase family)